MELEIKYGNNIKTSIDITENIIKKFLIEDYNIIYIPINTNFEEFLNTKYNDKVFIFVKYKNYEKIIDIDNEYIIIDLNNNEDISNLIKIKYGLDNNFIDISKEILQKYFNFTSHILYIDKNFNLNYIKGDPYPNIIKKVFISYKKLMIEIEEYRNKNIKINYINNATKKNKNIIIYPHVPYTETDGGINVMYNLARILRSEKQNVKIYNVYGNIQNKLYNEYFENNFDIDDSIVIYCEGTYGNPLNAKYVIRWLLSELGKNVEGCIFKTWGKNDLIYYFNYEPKIDNNKNYINNIYKLLPILYIDPNIKNNNRDRNNKICYTIRKNYHNKDFYKYSVERNHFEITRNFSFQEIINVFNIYKYFISYDPLTFLNIIAALCGCISIIYPLENTTKIEWYKKTAVYPYLLYKKIDSLYGIAYGLEDIEYAKNTMHLVIEQWNDIQQFLKSYTYNFIEDINNFENCINTIDYEAKKIINSEFDIYFYGSYYKDLKKFSPYQLITHYLNHGKNENRMININDFYNRNPNFDIYFYKNYYKDIKKLNLNDYQIIEHYINHGKNENRIINNYLKFNIVNKNFDNIKNFGFIMTRHVNSIETNKYWNRSVQLLRLYYPENKIIIIDDNSKKEFIKEDFNCENILIIDSEYKGRGELLPYIYFLNNKWFENAVIIHDSVFFHKKYDFNSLICKMIPLWYFVNNDSEIGVILNIANYLENNEDIIKNIINWNDHKWVSCFGVMNFINFDFLKKINNKYKLTNLINVVKTRSHRCALERIFGIIYYIETNEKNTLFGLINDSNIPYSLNYDYNYKKYIESFICKDIIKIWTGR